MEKLKLYPQRWAHPNGHFVIVDSDEQAFEASCCGFYFEKLVNG